MRIRSTTFVTVLVCAMAIAIPTTTATAEEPNPNVLKVVSPTPYVESEPISIDANFAVSQAWKLTLWTDKSGVWAPVPGTAFNGRTASSSGNYVFTYRVFGAQTVQVRIDTGEGVTNELELAPTPTTAVLDPIATVGPDARATAHFTPARSGQATELQVETIETKETDEVNADEVRWKKIASSKQDSSGNTTFSLTDPLEVKHKYRAVSAPSGATVKSTSNVVEYAQPLLTKNTGLATIHFNSNEGDSVDTRTRYFEGEFSMTGSSLIPACQAVAPVKKSTMKGRGNYSWSFAKKSFTLKVDKAKNLCGMGESKKWALVANHYDKSLLRSAVAFNLGSKLTNMAWTPKATPVDLYVNGSYRGSYSLVERIAIQNTDPEKPAVTPRIAIDELKDEGQATDPNHPNNQPPNITGGYILEWDFRRDADKNVTVGGRGYVGIKDPEHDLDREGNRTDEGISPQQVDYINDYVDDADRALFGSNFTSNSNGWQKYIDKASAVDYYIGMEMMKPVDGNMWASVYMYKPRGDKLQFGPMWDYDLAAGSANRAGNTVGTSGWYLRNPLAISAKQSTKTWFNRLNEDPEFRSAVRSRWNNIYSKLSSTNFIEDQAAILEDSARENFRKWSVTTRDSDFQVVKGSWSKEVSYLKSWMSSRRSWMNGQY